MCMYVRVYVRTCVCMYVCIILSIYGLCNSWVASNSMDGMESSRIKNNIIFSGLANLYDFNFATLRSSQNLIVELKFSFPRLRHVDDLQLKIFALVCYIKDLKMYTNITFVKTQVC